MQMESLISGTMAGAGSFRCQQCGCVVSLAASDALPACPGCHGSDFTRASLFSLEQSTPIVVHEHQPPDRERWLEELAETIEKPGDYLVYMQDGEVFTVPLAREWTRIGRSLTADVRIDDPTVSRRHALVVRNPDGVRVLDDRSLNGVFVNGERVEWRTLAHGDEIVVGRYSISFLRIGVDAGTQPVPTADSSAEAVSGMRELD
jgi:FHA domain/Zinc-ribbon containing domain